MSGPTSGKDQRLVAVLAITGALASSGGRIRLGFLYVKALLCEYYMPPYTPGLVVQHRVSVLCDLCLIDSEMVRSQSTDPTRSSINR